MDAQRGSIFEVGVGIPLQSRDNQVQVRASTRCAIGMASLRAGGCASACMCIFQQGQQWWHLAQLLHDQAQHKCMQALVSMAICICALLQVVHVVKPLMCVLHVAHGLYVVHVSRCEVVGCLHRLHAHLDMSISTGRKQSAQTCINCCRSQSRHFCASPHTSTKTTLAMASGLLPPPLVATQPRKNQTTSKVFITVSPGLVSGGCGAPLTCVGRGAAWALPSTAEGPPWLPNPPGISKLQVVFLQQVLGGNLFVTEAIAASSQGICCQHTCLPEGLCRAQPAVGCPLPKRHQGLGVSPTSLRPWRCRWASSSPWPR